VTGDTISTDKAPVVLESIDFPAPVIELAVEPKTKVDQEKMGIALQRLAEEDPTFRVNTDEDTGQVIIAGMGELHLEIIRDRMLREFKVDANAGKPQIAYRETITTAATGEGKLIKQSGGRGQYGHVIVNVRPGERGDGVAVRGASSVRVVGGLEVVVQDSFDHVALRFRRVLDEAEAKSSDRDEQIAAANDAWYRGFVADAFLAFQELEWMDSSGERHAGRWPDDCDPDVRSSNDESEWKLLRRRQQRVQRGDKLGGYIDGLCCADHCATALACERLVVCGTNS